jgi:hypothetical protein
METSSQLNIPVPLPLGKQPFSSHRMGLVDPRVGLDAIKKDNFLTPYWNRTYFPPCSFTSLIAVLNVVIRLRRNSSDTCCFRHIENITAHGSVLLKWIVEKSDIRVWSAFFWLRTWPSGGRFVNSVAKLWVL